jgi:hypothetical protein
MQHLDSGRLASFKAPVVPRGLADGVRFAEGFARLRALQGDGVRLAAIFRQMDARGTELARAFRLLGRRDG